jgi:hypothetical protein
MRKIYEVFRTVLTTVVAGIVIAVLGEFAIEIAREYGFYTRPTERVGDFLNLIRNLPWFWPSIAGLGGFVSGMWIDTFVLRHVRSRQSTPAEAPKSDLEILFDETSDRFVRFSTEKMRQQRLVGIHNRGNYSPLST